MPWDPESKSGTLNGEECARFLVVGRERAAWIAHIRIAPRGSRGSSVCPSHALGYALDYAP